MAVQQQETDIQYKIHFILINGAIMNRSVKYIIFGFALMFLGGTLFLADAIQQIDMDSFWVFLSYGLFLGFLFIIIGLFFPLEK